MPNPFNPDSTERVLSSAQAKAIADGLERARLDRLHATIKSLSHCGAKHSVDDSLQYKEDFTLSSPNNEATNTRAIG